METAKRKSRIKLGQPNKSPLFYAVPFQPPNDSGPFHPAYHDNRFSLKKNYVLPLPRPSETQKSYLICSQSCHQDPSRREVNTGGGSSSTARFLKLSCWLATLFRPQNLPSSGK